MEKLSLYEILSYVIPGFILIAIVEIYNQYVFENLPLYNHQGKFEDSIILFISSLFLGIIIHIITFRMLKKSKNKCIQKFKKSYQTLIYKSPQALSASNKEIQKIIPFLNREYIRLRKHQEEAVGENQAENNLFDFAYIYLEIHDKIAPAKSFQSLYFWFRNMFTISLLLVPFSILIYILTVINGFYMHQQKTAILFFFLNVVFGLIVIPIANWLREKLVHKIMWSYYVARIHENEKNNQ
jgi:hypothetical protein